MGSPGCKCVYLPAVEVVPLLVEIVRVPVYESLNIKER